ncbi:hypothetical protein LINPERHAP2_LOCUS24732 [Linum perenne]
MKYTAEHVEEEDDDDNREETDGGDSVPTINPVGVLNDDQDGSDQTNELEDFLIAYVALKCLGRWTFLDHKLSADRWIGGAGTSEVMTDRGWSWLRVVGIPIHLRSDTIFDSIARAFRESAVADVCGCNLNEVKVKALNPGQVLDAVMLKFGEARFHLQVPEIFSDGGAGSEPDSGSGGGGGGGCCLYGQEKSRWEGEKVSEDFLRGDVVTETEGVCKFDGKRPLRVGKGPALSNFGDSAPRTSASISEEKVDKRVCSDLMEVFWKGSNFLPQVIKEVGRKEVVGLAKVAGGKPFEDPVSPSGPGSSSTDDALTREEVERVGLGLSQRFRPDNGFESPSLLSKGEIKRGTMLSDRAEEAVEEGLAAVREKDPEKEQLDALVSQFQVVSEVLQLELNSSKVEARERETKLASWDDRCSHRLTGSTSFRGVSLQAVGASGGLLTLWDSNVFEVEVEWQGFFSLVVVIRNKMYDFKWLLINAYGPQGFQDKVDFIHELSDFCSWWVFPSCIVGDFNMIRSLDETRGTTRARREMRLLNEFIDELGLIDLPLSGAEFTWSDFRRNAIVSRLDRMPVSTDWEDKFPFYRVEVMARS